MAEVRMEEYGIADRIVDPPREFAHTLALGAIETVKSVATGPSSRALTMIDLGTCDARTTIPFFRECAARLRAACEDPERAVCCVFEDHVHNNWVPVMRRNLKADLGPGVFPLASNTTFFEQTMPPETVDFAFTNCAWHYLSGPPPVSMQSAIRHVSARDKKAKSAFAEAAAADWETLLVRRAAELRPGGVLVISNFARDESRDWYWGKTDAGASLYDELADCLQELVNQGALTPEEQRAATSPAYYRTLAEHLAPFNDPDSPVRAAGLVLKSSGLNITRCPLRADFLNRSRDGVAHVNLHQYATTFANCLRAVTVWEIARAFSHPDNSRPDAERRDLIDRVYANFADRVRQRPLDFAFDSVMAVLVVEKLAS